MIINNSSLGLMANNLAIIIIAMFATFWLSACSVSPSSQVPAQTDNAVSDASDINIDPMSYQDCVYPPKALVTSCQAQGGSFIQQGRLGCYSCVLKYDDAGKACQDSTDCLGNCQNTSEFFDSGATNKSGQCSADSSRFGCRHVYDNLFRTTSL